MRCRRLLLGHHRIKAGHIHNGPALGEFTGFGLEMAFLGLTNSVMNIGHIGASFDLNGDQWSVALA